jgi:aspartate racemase
MKKIGILAGGAWSAAIEYYSQLCRLGERQHRAAARTGAAPLPEIVVESLNPARIAASIGTLERDDASWWQFDEYHRAALRRLHLSGARFALMIGDLAHHRFAPIVRGLRVPVIDIVDVVASECARMGAGRAILLGTELTMTSATFVRGFAAHGVTAVSPRDGRARLAIAELITKLRLGKGAGAAEKLGEIARDISQARRSPARTVVCLMCSELSLAFPGQRGLALFDMDGTMYINAPILHVDTAFKFACDEPALHTG